MSTTTLSTAEFCQAFEQLLHMVATMRKQCPWGQQQTMESLRHLTIEETFELAEAISTDNQEAIKEELGDLLLHLMLYTQLATEQKQFTVTEVVQTLIEKFTQRHPTLYSPALSTDTKTVQTNWQKQKLQEKGTDSFLAGIPRALPSLIKALRIQDKARELGLQPDNTAIVHNIQTAFTTFMQAAAAGDTAIPTLEKQLGKLLFKLMQYALALTVDPDKALENENQQFIQKMRSLASQIHPVNPSNSIPD